MATATVQEPVRPPPPYSNLALQNAACTTTKKGEKVRSRSAFLQTRGSSRRTSWVNWGDVDLPLAGVAVITSMLGIHRRRSVRRGQRTTCEATASKKLAPNGSDALQALREWRKKSKESESKRSEAEFSGDDYISDGLKHSKEKSTIARKEWLKIQRQPKSTHGVQKIPSCVAMWHSMFKGMDSKTFFETVQSRPGLLEVYTKDALQKEREGGESVYVIETIVSLVLQSLVGAPKNGEAEPLEIVDLGCGRAELAEALQSSRNRSITKPTVISVDAAPLVPGVEVHNIGALPAGWTDRFQIVVLSRAIWGKDYTQIIAEAKRVLKKDSSGSARLLIVEPFKRWWGKDKERPNENALLRVLADAGLKVDPVSSIDIEPRPGDVIEGFFQYVVAQIRD
eukprot:TRINITY_DN10219_c1_g1_i1.p1 TRINITY_DN10219_c1_g1~~TRINITY_DN10219_c1_g1_i1.p1  ORF type:complete len:443 (-),score=60.33 TRINITY_DN10219_c1_g1_i1:76-1263(-)